MFDRINRPGDDAPTRDRILEVALRAFAELGFDGASTREIASRAGVNQGLIPYYFGTKQALWREAVGRAFARLEAIAEAVRDTREVGSRERLALLIRRYLHFVAAHPEFVMLMNEEGKRDSERMRWLVDTHVHPLFTAMSAFYEQAASEDGLVLPVATPHLQYLFVGAASAIFHQAPECRRLFGIDPMDPQVVERHADALVRLFLGDEKLGREPATRDPA